LESAFVRRDGSAANVDEASPELERQRAGEIAVMHPAVCWRRHLAASATLSLLPGIRLSPPASGHTSCA